MKMKWIVTNTLAWIFVSTHLFATANAPIQRIDVVNLLSNSTGGGSGGVTPTPVTVSFSMAAQEPVIQLHFHFQVC